MHFLAVYKAGLFTPSVFVNLSTGLYSVAAHFKSVTE